MPHMRLDLTKQREDPASPALKRPREMQRHERAPPERFEMRRELIANDRTGSR